MTKSTESLIGRGELKDTEAPSIWVNSFGFNEKWSVASEPLHWLIDSIDTVHHPGTEGEALDREREKQKREAVAGSGCGLSFAKELVKKSGVPIGMVPCAHGGTTCIKVMTNWIPLQQRGKIMPWWGTCYQVGDMIATAFAGFIIGLTEEKVAYGPGGEILTSYFNWRWVFWVPSIILFIIAFLVILLIRNRPEDIGLSVAEKEETKQSDSEKEIQSQSERH